MSTVSLADVKDFLNVTHALDDDKIQALIDSAEDEALKFMNRTTFGELCETDSNFDSTTNEIPMSVVTAVKLLVEAMYDAKIDGAELYRKTAERLMMPYRCNMGM